MNIEYYESNFEAAKVIYHEIMKGDNDASILFKWMITNEINPYEIFHESSYASMVSTLEGMVGLYRTLYHALYDDGDVTFVKTSGTSPKIVFVFKNENYFQDHYNRFIQSGCESICKIVGYCDNVQEFINAHNEYENKRKKIFQRFNNLRKN
jgi:hypothetical protein